jgi:hypothetical protein
MEMKFALISLAISSFVSLAAGQLIFHAYTFGYYAFSIGSSFSSSNFIGSPTPVFDECHGLVHRPIPLFGFQ